MEHMKPKRSPSRLLLVGVVGLVAAAACIWRGTSLPESNAARVSWAWAGIILGVNGLGAVLVALVGRRKPPA
jgi:hypothetical protein